MTEEQVDQVRESPWYQDVIGLLEQSGRTDLREKVEWLLEESGKPEVARLKFHYDGMEEDDRQLRDPSVPRERKVEILADQLALAANLTQAMQVPSGD